LANAVAKHVGLFDEVLASDGRRNLRGHHKLEALIERFGDRGFDTRGNSSVDLAVWKGTRESNRGQRRPQPGRQAARIAKVGHYFPPKASPLLALLKAVRPHQWLKNLIVFVPIITSHQMSFWPMVAGAAAFTALCLCASAGYVLNDLMDLDADRHHPANRRRRSLREICRCRWFAARSAAARRERLRGLADDQAVRRG